MSTKFYLNILCLLTLCCSLSSCTFSKTIWKKRELEFTENALQAQKLDIKTHNGLIKIIAADTETISVVASIKAGGSTVESAERSLKALEIRHVLVNDTLSIYSEWSTEKEYDWRATVNYNLIVPKSMITKARTHNGSINIDGTLGDCNSQTHNGSITVLNHSGNLRAHTHNGSIQVESNSPNLDLQTHNGKINGLFGNSPPVSGAIQTHNGSIEVSFSPDSDCQISCNVHNGSISAAAQYAIQSKTKKSLTVQLGDASSQISIKTHNGSITLGSNDAEQR